MAVVARHAPGTRDAAAVVPGRAVRAAGAAAQPGDVQFILLLPPMAVLAAFALPTLPRAAINAIDWFSLLFFTILAASIWFMWIAKTTGWPPRSPATCSVSCRASSTRSRSAPSSSRWR
jgi:hypothetical protein